MIIKLSNNIEYPVVYQESNGTRVETAANPNYRNKMFIYMDINRMPVADFIRLFSEKSNLEKITFKDESFESDFVNYTVTAFAGKKLVQEENLNTGEVITVMRLAAELEQPTRSEEQLDALALQAEATQAQAVYTAMMTDTLIESGV